MARHLQRRSGVKKLMHVDEDDVASRVGEGGVRSGKEGRLVRRSGAATRAGWLPMEGEGGSRSRRKEWHGECDRRRSRAPRLGLEGRTARTKFQKSTHDDWTSIMKCFINAINLIEKFWTRIPLDLIGPIKDIKNLGRKYPWAKKGPVVLIR